MNVAELGVNLGGAYSREREKGEETSTETATKVEDTVEDKLVVPPGYKMTATIKTYQVKYIVVERTFQPQEFISHTKKSPHYRSIIYI